MQLHATRLPRNPIVTVDSHPSLGANVNGPSLIRVPDWLPNPLGRYYLYFAHHQGESIRLAYADDLAGPWTVHAPGTLQLQQTRFSAHIASPDVHVDDANQRLVMYYHGCGCDRTPPKGVQQPTSVAFSSDGVTFETESVYLGHPYFRVFQVGGVFYSVAAAGQLARSEDGFTNWEGRTQTLDHSARHWAVLVRDGVIHWFYSRWGDAPEHLLYGNCPADPDWRNWRIENRVSLLRPTLDWEGANQPIAVSLTGSQHTPVHELRDPAVYAEGERTYLLYSIAGEQGIAIAQLTGL